MRSPSHLLHSISRSISAPLPTRRSSGTATATATATIDPRSQRRLRTSPLPDSVERLVLAGRVKDAVRSLVLLHSQGQPVGPDALCSIIRYYTGRGALMQGRQLHAHITVVGFGQDTFVFNHLIDMYGKGEALDDARSIFRTIRKKNLHSWNTLMACYSKTGCLSVARELFDEMSKQDSVSWNLMISGYDRHGPCEEALRFFKRMRHSGAQTDHFGASSVVSACSNLGFIGNGKALHGYSIKVGVDSHVHVGSALVELYAKCMDICDARRVFDLMDVREHFTWNSMLAGYVHCLMIDQALTFFSEMPNKDVVSWTTVIEGCSQHDLNDEAIAFFHRMRESGLQADQVAFVSVLNACVGLLNSEEGSKIHGLTVKSGHEINAVVGSVIVALYAKCGNLDDARRVTSIMPVVDDFSWSVLIAEYAKHGQVESSCELFESLEVKSVPLWNALITGYSELEMYEEALEAFKEMSVDGQKADDFTYGSLLMGSNTFGLRYGKQLHSLVIKAGVNFSVFLCSALVDMYFCFSDWEAAEKVFNTVDEPNCVLWNVMIFGYGQNNLHCEAWNTFRLMRVLGTRLDNITLSCALDSCSSTSALACGKQVHALACKVGFESDVVVGTAIIDMYGKCGNMEHASLALFDIHQPNVISWTALLGGYVKCGMWTEANVLFNVMPERNVVTWNVMLSGYVQQDCGLEALKLYSRMNESGILPDHITFVNLLTVCCKFLLKEQGSQVHAQIIKTGYCINTHVSVILTYMHQKLGMLVTGEDARSLYTSKPIRSADYAEPDVPSWNI